MYHIKQILYQFLRDPFWIQWVTGQLGQVQIASEFQSYNNYQSRMGINGSKAKPPSKFQIEIMATKVREYLNLQKERKSNDAVKEEKTLMKLLNNPGRSKLEEYLAMERIVGLLKIISADRILMSYADIVKQNSTMIAEPSKNMIRIGELMPYILSIIYSAKPLGLNCMNDFKSMMMSVFGREMLELSMQETASLPVELKNCFDRVTPSFQEVNQYAIEMCQRNQFSLETLNMVGHNFSPYAGQLNVQQGIIPQPPQGLANGAQNFGNPNGGFGGPNGGNNGNGGFNGGFNGGNGYEGNNGGNNNFGGNFNNGGNNNFGGDNPYGGNNGNSFGNQGGNNGNSFGNQGGNGNGGYGLPAEYTPAKNQGFNPNNFIPIYEPTNFDIPSNKFNNPNNQFNDVYIPKNVQPPANNFNYPRESNLYGDLDKNLDDRLKKL